MSKNGTLRSHRGRTCSQSSVFRIGANPPTNANDSKFPPQTGSAHNGSGVPKLSKLCADRVAIGSQCNGFSLKMTASNDGTLLKIITLLRLLLITSEMEQNRDS